MPPKITLKPKKKKEIEITPALLKHGEDSSDEDDNYSDISDDEVVLNAGNFSAINPNLPTEDAFVAYVLEDEGRRVLYNKETRAAYQEKKGELLVYEEDDFGKIEVNFLDLVKEGLNFSVEKLASLADENLRSRIDEALKLIADLPDLPRIILKQSNREFILSELSDIFNPIIEYIVAENIKKIKAVPALQHQDEYKITPHKISCNDSLKKQLAEKIKNELLQIKQSQRSVAQKFKSATDKFGVSITDSIKKYLTEEDAKFSNNSVNAIVTSILTKEIGLYLDESFIDRIKVGKSLDNSYLLKMALDLANDLKIKTITECKKSVAESVGVKDSAIQRKSLYIREEFGRFFVENLNRLLAEKISLPKKVLKKTYSDPAKIESPSDLYSKEHLLYRSATRQARTGEQEVARSVVFDDDDDLVAQKWQAIKAEAKSSAGHISYRGTIQEEVYNLGNYESVLEKIGSLNLSDKGSATVIRSVYKFGIDKGLNCLSVGGKTLAEVFNHQQKQTIIELVELFFGTEAFRSPSTIVETNMALDLIIAEKLSWENALTGKKTTGRGGELSFTMKSSEQKAGNGKEKIEGAGGIECGRRLSEDVNRYHDRMHKYGGEPIGRNTGGYKEYLSRKKEITDKWLDLQAENGKPKTSIANPSAVKYLIREQDNAWYNR